MSLDCSKINLNYELGGVEMYSEKEKLLSELELGRDKTAMEIEKTQNALNFYYNFEEEYEKLENEFNKKTSIINKKDQAFLWICVALQLVRQVMQPALKIEEIKPEYSDRNSAKEEAKKENKTNSEFYNENKSDAEKTKEIEEKALDVNSIEEYAALNWHTYFVQKVPYDAMYDAASTTDGVKSVEIPGIKEKGKNLNPKNHHSATYGHDPYLGFIFGVINIITYSITVKSNLHTNRVAVKGKEILEEVGFCHALMVAVNAVVDDKNKLSAAVSRQVLHLESDEYSKMGLPIPGLKANIQQKLLELGWNSKEFNKIMESMKKNLVPNMGIVAIQTLLDLFIKAIIFILHRIWYDPELDGDKSLYDVRTLKIIDNSGLIAEGVNIATVVGTTVAGAYSNNPKLIRKGISKLDLGGIISTIGVNIASKKIRYNIMLEYVNTEIDKKLGLGGKENEN